jgi:hypothetical protein
LAVSRGVRTRIIEAIEWGDGHEPSGYGAAAWGAFGLVRATTACIARLPIYWASYSARRKHFPDRALGDLLAGKPPCLLATDGGPQDRLDFSPAPLFTQLGEGAGAPALAASSADPSDVGLSDELRPTLDAGIGALLAS